MLALLALAAAALSSGAPPISKGPYPLSDRIDDATLICVGRVTHIYDVPSPIPLRNLAGELRTLRVARVAVERVLKGDKSTSVVHHEAWPTWMCDTSSARIGERALFLLGPGLLPGYSKQIREVVYQEIGTETVYRNVGSGDGILRIRKTDGTEVVGVAEAPLALRSEVVHLASDFGKVLSYVERVCEYSLDAVRVHARWNSTVASPNGGFDLRILPDGRARLARLGPFNSEEGESTYSIDEATWSRLQKKLGALVAGKRRKIGDAPRPHLQRRLALRFDDGELVLREGWKDFHPGGSEERRATLKDALQAWALVHATLDCPGCEDQTEHDHALLEYRPANRTHEER